MSRLELDLTCLTAAGGPAGIPLDELEAVAQSAARAVDKLEELCSSGAVGFYDLSDGKDLARA
jgi:hypothetical protein